MTGRQVQDERRRLLLVGASGLVGRQVLEQALADPRVAAVVAPSRRALPQHPRLSAPHVDFEHLDAGAPWWRAGLSKKIHFDAAQESYCLRRPKGVTPFGNPEW